MVIRESFPQIEIRSFQSRQLLPLFSTDFTANELSLDFPAMIYSILNKDELLWRNLNLICKQVHWHEINLNNDIWIPSQMQLMIDNRLNHNFSFIRNAPEGVKVLIHMGTGSPQKLMPPEFWVYFLNRLKNRFEITFLYGPAEKNIFLDGFPEIPTIQKVSLQELMIKMADFRYYIGLDSGISHLAGCMGLKGLALFHQTNPCYWRPMGKINAVCIEKNNPTSWNLALQQFLKEASSKS